MGRGSTASVVATLVMAVATSAWAATGGEPVPLAAHRAVYDFTLARASAGGVTDMTGRMVYELTGSACEGYNQTMRFVTRATSQDGSVAINDMRSTSFEDATGKSLRFTFNQYRDDKLSETTVGDASRSADGVRIELEKPEKKNLTVGRDALFPIQHSLRLLEAARTGQNVFQSDLYDGSDKGSKVYNTTAVIGRARNKGHNATLPKIENAERLDAYRAWPVSLSYFETASQAADAVPSYELAFTFFENGVVRQLTLDYGDFALRGDLRSIEFLDTARCEKK